MSDDVFKLTGEKPMSMRGFMKLRAAEFTRREPTVEVRPNGGAGRFPTATPTVGLA
jgi:hypothetical protein